MPSQQHLDFRGADADAESSFRYRMNRLREQLAGVSVAATGLSPRRWAQVKECLMAVFSYELAGRQPELGKLLRTSGLSRDQWYVARQHALELGLAVSVRAYTGARRCADSLSIDFAGLDRLARAGPTKSDQHRPSPTNTDQVRPTPTTIKEETARAIKDLPNNYLTNEPPPEVFEDDWRRMVVVVSACGVNQAISAIESMRNCGATPQDVERLVSEWRGRAANWPVEFRPHILYRRLRCWRGDQKPEDGWPPAQQESVADRLAQFGAW